MLVAQEKFGLTDVVIATVELSPSMEYVVEFSSLSPPPGGPPPGGLQPKGAHHGIVLHRAGQFLREDCFPLYQPHF